MNENPGEHSGENPGEHASETSGSTVAAEKDQQLDGLVALFSDAVNGQRSLAITGIFVMLLFYTLYFAAPVLIPITLALLLNMLLAPGVVLLTRLRIPQALAAALVVLSAVMMIIGALYVLSGPAQEWLQKAPASFYKVEQKLRELKKPIEDIKKATEQIEEATQLNKLPQAQEVTIQRASLTDLLLSGTPQIVATTGIVTILVYFLLASGDTFLRKLVTVIPTLRDKKRAVEIVRNIQEDISFYLLTITLTNLGLGLLVSAALGFIGVPNPMLWGAMVAILNFAPYIGAITNLIILTIVGILTFDSLTQALLIPGVFAIITVLISHAILPAVLGRRLLLSPVAIFIAIMLWGWLWGVLGALLAVPLLASFKIICERVEPLRPIAEFLTP